MEVSMYGQPFRIVETSKDSLDVQELINDKWHWVSHDETRAAVIEQAFITLKNRWLPVYSDEQIEKMRGPRAYHILNSGEFAEVSRAALEAKVAKFEEDFGNDMKKHAEELNQMNELWTNGLAQKKTDE